MKKLLGFSIICVCFVCFLPGAMAKVKGDHYINVWEGDEGGRAVMTSPSYKLEGVSGVAIIGNTTSSNYKIGSGYFKTINPDNLSPAPVSVLNALATDIGGINLEWQVIIDEGSFVDKYKIYRSTKKNEFSKIAIAELDVNNYTDNTGLIYGVTYYYKIQAIDIGGNECNEGNIIVSALSKSLSSSVDNAVAKSKSSGRILLTWKKISGASFYRIYRATTLGEKGGCITNDGEITDEKYVDTSNNLINGKKYYYTIQVVDGSGNEQSNGNNQTVALSDATPPKPPVIQSATHIETKLSSNINPSFKLVESSDENVGEAGGTGIAGYYYFLSKSVSSSFDTDNWQFTSESQVQYSNLDDGEWYFYVATMDNAENKSSVSRYSIKILTKGAISGVLKNPSNKIPLSDALIQLLQNQKVIASAKTDSEGRYGFNSIPFGNYQLKITAKGYKPFIFNIDNFNIDNSLLTLADIFKAEPLISLNEVASYPNPAKGSKITFLYYVPDTSEVVINVYNVNGDRIATFSEYKSGGNFQETYWDINDVAQGIYIYQIAFKSSSTNSLAKYPIKKLAIIR